LPYDADLYFVIDDLAESHRVELVRQLALIGLDRVAGVFGGDAVRRAAARGAALESVPQITVSELARHVAAADVQVVDVRSESEWRSGHIPTAMHVPLGYLLDRLNEVPADRPVIVHCQAGKRSAIAASVLKRAGRERVVNLTGGMDAWVGEGEKVTRGS
jgi:hydroxyacylglutathione hydrolase